MIDKNGDETKTCYEAFLLAENKELRNKVAAMEKVVEAGGWISIKDRPIEGDDFFIANFRNKPPFIAKGWRFTVHNPHGCFYKYTGGEIVHINNITHWMPLPEEPKEKS